MSCQYIDLQCFGNISYYKNLIHYTSSKFLLFEPYKKRSFRNRYFIAGANGVIDLTIPLKYGRDQKQEYKNVRIDYTQNWQRSHLKSIVSSYNRSPWFEYYSDAIETLIMQKYDYLFECNIAFLDWSIKSLKSNIEFSILEQQSEQSVVVCDDNRNKILPANYLDMDAMTYSRYCQVFEDRLGFLPNLSILDLIFCVGPDANTYLK